ncbi:MAG: TonB-dependent receptor [Bacteroidales bacterium]|nr:TonB-dependent receptor [Bacteroidales bacterium]
MKIKIPLLAGIIILPFITLFGQQDTTVYIEEILVQAEKSDKILQTNISASEIELNNPRDAGEIFKDQAGFGIVKRGNYAQEPVLRGFKYEQLNVLIDGGTKSTAACPNRMDPAISQISPDEIEKVEVIRGPYSVRYGATMGGILNVISRKPVHMDELKIRGSLEGGFESNGSNLYSNLHVLAIDKKYDAAFNASWKDFGNYESGSGEEIASAFKRLGYSLKLGYNPKQNQRIQLSWRQGFGRDILHAGLPMDADEDNSSMVSLDYSVTNLSASLLSFKTKVYGSFVDHEMSNKRRPNTAIVDAVSITDATVIGGRAELSLKGGTNDILYIGIDANSTQKDGTRHRIVYKNVCTTPPTVFDPPKEFDDLVFQDSKVDDFGVFAENRLQIHENLMWMTGIRLDVVTASIRNPAADFIELYGGTIEDNTDINPGATTALTWKKGDGPELQWAVGRGVRSAEITERYINHFTVGMDAHEYVGNPNLKPEVNYQTDLRIEQDFKGTTAYANVFYSFIENYISAFVDSTLPRKYMPCMEPKFAKRFINVDESFMTGFEVGVQVTFVKKILVDVNAGYTYAQNVTMDEPLPEVPPLMVNATIYYKTEKLQTGIKGRIATEQNRVATSFSETATPGFSVFDFLFSFQPIKLLEIKFSVTNILNQNYAEHLSRPYKNMDSPSLYYEPGRSFNVGAKLMF